MGGVVITCTLVANESVGSCQTDGRKEVALLSSIHHAGSQKDESQSCCLGHMNCTICIISWCHWTASYGTGMDQRWQ